MTTRNFRVKNGLSVGDITISASANTITGLTTSAPSADGDVANKKYVDDQINLISSESITVEGQNTSVAVADSGSNGAITGTADGGVVYLATSANTTITASSNINLTATGDVVIPADVGVTFGDAGEKIEGNGTNLTISSSGTLNLTATGETLVSNNLRVGGNLTVDGTETIINTTTLSVEDNIIELNRNVSNNAGMPSISGIKVNRGEGSTATEQALFWAWDETFADDGSTIFGNAGGAFTAFKKADGDSGTPGASDLVDIRANVIYATATSAQYADIAERFAADAPITPGAVVMLGGSEEITETAEDLSDRVFGVISTQPAYMMNNGAGNNDSHPFVAMTGRTPVRVTGEVRKGDRLVSSSIRGTARAASADESINPFHVIGRALEDKFDDAIGLVNCVVRTNN